MNKKSLLLALLTLTGPMAAMEPIEPASLIAQSGETHKTISPDSQCPVCMEQADKVDKNQLKITQCCHNFICATCENDINQNARANAAQYQTAAGQMAFIAQHGFAPRNQLKATCPLCRKDLKTDQARLASNQKPLDIVDVNGTEFTLEAQLSEALLKCTNLAALEAHPGVLDFSSLEHTFLTKKMIISLATTINNPVAFKVALDSTEPIAPHVTKLNPKAFEIAHYLGAPDNVLFILANELWPYIQEQPNDTEPMKQYKKNLRHIARPHLASPKHFLHFLRSKPTNDTYHFKTHYTKGTLLNPEGGIQLDFDSLKIFYRTLRDTGWYTYDNSDWYIKYPFCSLDGLKELLKYLGLDLEGNKKISLNLSRHKLETFSCDILPNIGILNLSYNNIRKLTGSCLAVANTNYVYSLPTKIILESNPIETIDESFFEALRKKRATSYNNCEIILQNSNLTAAQKEEVRKKFYKATHTIPQRYLNSRMFGNAFVYGGCLAGIAGALYATNKLADYAPNITKGISVATATGIGVLMGASREFLRGPALSRKWMLFDAAAGATGAYFGAHKILNKFPALAKVFPMAFTGLAGSVTGYFAGWKAGTITANGLAKLSHPEIPWNNENWSMGDYTLEL